MSKNRIYRGCCYLALSILVFGCGGGGGGDTTGRTDTPLDVAGVWTIVETSGVNTCEEPVGIEDTYQVTVSQSGTVLTVVTPMGTFNGSIAGDILSWTGSFSEDEGTTTITLMDLTAAADGLSFSGSADWTWTDGSLSCSGSVTIDGSKETTPPPSGLNVSGTWTVIETSGANTCEDPVGVEGLPYEMTLTQVGSTLTVINPAGTFTGTLTGDIISWTGSFLEEGGTTTLTGVALTVDGTENNFSGSVDWTWSDGSFTCTGTTTAVGSR